MELILQEKTEASKTLALLEPKGSAQGPRCPDPYSEGFFSFGCSPVAECDWLFSLLVPESLGQGSLYDPLFLSPDQDTIGFQQALRSKVLI